VIAAETTSDLARSTRRVSMADEQPRSVRHGASQARPEPTDESPGGFGLGRRLRVLAGVDEELLGWVPCEYARYTGLGGVVLGTAIIAALSMWMALSQVLDGTYILAVLPVLIWGLFVLNLDRWLVSSATGTMWRRRAAFLFPRLLVALVLGIIVAEPLVLRVFQTAIEQHVRQERQQQVADLRSRMVDCNPSPRPATDRPECAGYIVSLGSTPAAIAQELASRERDVAALERRIAADSSQHERLIEMARRECAGVEGSGLSGLQGVGNRCRRLRRDADSFAAAHRLAENTAELSQLNTRVSELRASLRTAGAGYQDAVSTEIEKHVRALQATQGPIGLLERLRALRELTERNGFLLVATWFLRAFLILVDCLPVLVKLMSGTTAYDRLVDRWTSSSERVFEATVHDIEVGLIGDVDLKQHEHASYLRKRRQEIDVERRRHEAGIQASLAEVINARTADLLRRGRRAEQANGQARSPGVTEPSPNP